MAWYQPFLWFLRTRTGLPCHPGVWDRSVFAIVLSGLFFLFCQSVGNALKTTILAMTHHLCHGFWAHCTLAAASLATRLLCHCGLWCLYCQSHQIVAFLEIWCLWSPVCLTMSVTTMNSGSKNITEERNGGRHGDRKRQRLKLGILMRKIGCKGANR